MIVGRCCLSGLLQIIVAWVPAVAITQTQTAEDGPSIIVLRGSAEIRLPLAPEIRRLGIRIQQRQSGDACVAAVDDFSAGQQIGIHPGDCIIAIDGTPVETVEDVQTALDNRRVPSSLQSRDRSSQPRLFPAELLRSAGVTDAIRISSIRIGSRIDPVLRNLNLQNTPLAVVELNGQQFFKAGMGRAYASPSDNEPEIELAAKMLRTSTGKSVHLLIGTEVGTGDTVYDIQFDDWDNGIELGQRTRIDFRQIVRISPERVVQAITQAYQEDRLDQIQPLAAFGRLVSPQLEGALQGAIIRGGAALIQTRLQLAANAKASGDFQKYASILKKTLVELPQSKGTVESLISSDLNDGRELVRAGNGARAIERANWAKEVIPDSTAAQSLLSDAKSQVASDAMSKAHAREAEGAFEQAQAIVVAALKIAPDSRDLQAKLADLQKQLELDDKKKVAEANEAAQRAAAGRRAANLAELASACRTELDRKDYSTATTHCRALNSAYPEESVTKTLMARLRAVTPAPTRGTAEAGTRTAPPITSSRSNFGAPSLTGIRASTSAPAEPNYTGVELKAYDLMKNPFAYKSKLVMLDTTSYPRIVNDNVFDFFEPPTPESAKLLGLYGLKFNRMVAEDLALYDIRGVVMPIGTASDYMVDLGQLLLSNIHATHLPKLDDRSWMVECLGTTEATNLMGAPISIPTARYWGGVNIVEYYMERDIPPISNTAEGIRSNAKYMCKSWQERYETAIKEQDTDAAKVILRTFTSHQCSAKE